MLPAFDDEPPKLAIVENFVGGGIVGSEFVPENVGQLLERRTFVGFSTREALPEGFCFRVVVFLDVDEEEVRDFRPLSRMFERSWSQCKSPCRTPRTADSSVPGGVEDFECSVHTNSCNVSRRRCVSCNFI